MADDFVGFMKKLGIRILPIATEEYGPGAILNENFYYLEATLKAIQADIGVPDDLLEVAEKGANMLTQTLVSRQKVQSGLNILGLLKVEGSVDRDLFVEYAVSGLKSKVLVNGFQAILWPKINALRKTNEPLWKQINDCIVVREAFYASEFTAVFKIKGNTVGKAELSDKVKPVTADGSVDWETDQQLRIANNLTVPIGVRGFPI